MCRPVNERGKEEKRKYPNERIPDSAVYCAVLYTRQQLKEKECNEMYSTVQYSRTERYRRDGADCSEQREAMGVVDAAARSTRPRRLLDPITATRAI